MEQRAEVAAAVELQRGRSLSTAEMITPASAELATA